MTQKASKADDLNALHARLAELHSLVPLFKDRPNNAGFIEEVQRRIADIQRQILRLEA